MVWSSIGPRIVVDGVAARLVTGTSTGGAGWGLCTNALSPDEASTGKGLPRRMIGRSFALLFSDMRTFLSV